MFKTTGEVTYTPAVSYNFAPPVVEIGGSTSMIAIKYE